jgi:arginase
MFTLSVPQWLGAARKGLQIESGSILLASECGDLGIAIDVSLFDATPDETYENNIVGRRSLIRNLSHVQRSLETNAATTTLLLGGDCSTDLAPIAHHAQRHDDLTIIYFDAHADLNQPAESPSGALHGMVLRHLLGDGDIELCQLLGRPITPSQIRYRGLRQCDPAETEIIRRLGIIDEPIAAAPPDGPLYVHLDLDVLDPAEFPHTTYPTLGGPSIAELNMALTDLLDTGRVVGLAMTECAVRDASDLVPLRPLLGTVAAWTRTS